MEEDRKRCGGGWKEWKRIEKGVEEDGGRKR